MTMTIVLRIIIMIINETIIIECLGDHYVQSEVIKIWSENKKIFSCSDLPEQMCTYGQDLPLIAGVWKKYSPMKDLFFSIKYYERWWDMIIMDKIWYDKILCVRENKRRTNQSHPHGCPIVLHLNSSQITWVLNLSSESEMQITRTTLSILYFLGSR